MTVPVREIVRMAGVVFGVPPSIIYSASKPRPISRARQAVYLIANEHGWSLSHIGRVLDRDHSSVRYGVIAAGEIAKRDQFYRERIEALRDHVRRWAPPAPLRLPTYLSDQEPETLAA